MKASQEHQLDLTSPRKEALLPCCIRQKRRGAHCRVGGQLGPELGCPIKPHQVQGCCDWWATLSNPYSKGQGYVCRVLKNYSARKNSAHKAASRLPLPCVSLAITLLMKATAGQVRTYGPPAQRPPRLSYLAPSELGARRELGWALHWISSCSVWGTDTTGFSTVQGQGTLPPD